MATFAELGVPAHLVRALERHEITAPTAIQAAAVPAALAGRDVAAQAPTGSGKTLAFGLPVLLRSGHGTPKRPASLILVPTRELATQIVDALRPLAGRDGLRFASVFGGVASRPQCQALRKGVDVVVGCPGRLEDLIGQGALRLDEVGLVVVDEADRMADVGFLPAVERLLALTPSTRQTLLFSATLSGPVGKLVERCQRNPERFDVEHAPEQRSRARHVAAVVAMDQRSQRTAEAVRAAGTAIVFTRTRHRADRVAKQLERLDLRAAVIHGGRSQAQRTRALDALHAGRVDVLVATDVAARGIHVDDLGCVVHYDQPEDVETYVHRSGRTGRAGAEGTVLCLLEPAQLDQRGSVRRYPLPAEVEVEVIDAGRIAAELAATAAPVRTPRPTPAARDERPADRPQGAPRDRRPRPEARPARGQDRQRPRDPAARRHGARPERATGDRVDGVVKFFHAGRGFGFIALPGKPDVFLHHTQLSNSAPRHVRDGRRVRFVLESGPRGPQAVDVEVL